MTKNTSSGTPKPGAKPPVKIRKLKLLAEISCLNIYVITVRDFQRDGSLELKSDPYISHTFDLEEAVQATYEIAHDHWIEAGHEHEDHLLAWRGYSERDDKGRPALDAPLTKYFDPDQLNTTCWHLDLVKPDGTVLIADFATLNENDITDLVADMEQEVLDTIIEIRAEADDIDLVMAGRGPSNEKH